MPLPSMGGASHRTFRAEGIICDVRETIVDATPERVFGFIGNVGGKNGWFYANFLWPVRGWIDRLIGGVGMKRGRPRASGIETGDVIDFWQVERAERCAAPRRNEAARRSMAAIQPDTQPHNRTLLRCCAWFQPRGLAGEIYWYGLYPVHALIFSGMLRKIRNHAAASRVPPRPP
jgi:hypothetical protein